MTFDKEKWIDSMVELLDLLDEACACEGCRTIMRPCRKCNRGVCFHCGNGFSEECQCEPYTQEEREVINHDLAEAGRRRTLC